MRFFQPLRPFLTATLVFVAALGAPLASHASWQLAVDMGCYNCHGDQPRGKAPRFERLGARLAGRPGGAAAEQHLMDEFRNGEWLEHVDAHERVSPETAKTLIRWLLEGAK
jgi:cytochrome c551/c552